MMVKIHVLLGAISALFLIFLHIAPVYALIFFLASVLIDTDHYLYYAFKNKDLSLRNAYAWFLKSKAKWRKLSLAEKKKSTTINLAFHSIELLIIVFLLSFYDKIFLFILAGMVFHLLVDYIEIVRYNDPLFIKFSQIYIMIRNNHILIHNK
jgi:hypothetical protein